MEQNSAKGSTQTSCNALKACCRADSLKTIECISLDELEEWPSLAFSECRTCQTFVDVEALGRTWSRGRRHHCTSNVRDSSRCSKHPCTTSKVLSSSWGSNHSPNTSTV